MEKSAMSVCPVHHRCYNNTPRIRFRCHNLVHSRRYVATATQPECLIATQEGLDAEPACGPLASRPKIPHGQIFLCHQQIFDCLPAHETKQPASCWLFCACMVNIFIRPYSQKNTHVFATSANTAPTPRQAARPKPEIRATQTAVPPKSRSGRLTRARYSDEPSITTIFVLLLLER